MRKLHEPRGLKINFKPSYKQYLVWQMLEPNRCEFCGSSLTMKVVGTDKDGHEIKQPVCSKCGTDDIPSLILYGGSAGSGKSYLGCCWLVSTCLRFPNMRCVVARKTLKVLKSTTWVTLMKVLNTFGLKQDVNYYIDNVNTTLHFWNGSSIMALQLAPSLQDPEYNNLGSLEISCFYCDEVSEVTEKAIEVLRSRCRWNTAETFVVPKALLASNPAATWIRSTFVQDDDGNPIKPAKGLRFVPSTVWENPDPIFRTTYINNLMKIRDPFTRRRLLEGDWTSPTDNKMAAYWNFDGIKHLAQKVMESHYNPMKPIILSLDFNVNPYMSCLPMQIDYDSKTVYVFPEYTGKATDKLNNTPAFARYLVKSMQEIRHTGGIILTGDPAGRARSTQTEDGVNNFTILADEFRNHGFRPSLKLFDKQPSQVTRLEFVNEVFAGYEGWRMVIDVRCKNLTADFIFQKKNPDGTKEKKKVQMETGEKAEKYGHLSDCLDYVLTYFLRDSYNRYRNGSSSSIVTTVSGNAQVYESFGY